MSNSNIPYTPTTWVDHFEDPITGAILQQGTDVNAENLNKLETGIARAVEDANQANRDIDEHIAKAEVHTTLAEKQATTQAINKNTQDITAHAQNQTPHVTAAEKATWNAKQNTLPNIMQTSVGQSMTQPLVAGGTQIETAREVRNAVILPSGTTDFTAIPNNTLICVKK